MSELRPSFLKNVSLEDLEIGANGRDAKKRSHARYTPWPPWSLCRISTIINDFVIVRSQPEPRFVEACCILKVKHYIRGPEGSISYLSTPPAKKTEPSNLVLRAQDHKKNPKFKGWQ